MLTDFQCTLSNQFKDTKDTISTDLPTKSFPRYKLNDRIIRGENRRHHTQQSVTEEEVYFRSIKVTFINKKKKQKKTPKAQFTKYASFCITTVQRLLKYTPGIHEVF